MGAEIKARIEQAPDRKMFYLCDGQACPVCDPLGSCRHTSDPAHAKHKADGQPHDMEIGPDGSYWEKEDDDT